MVVPHGGVLVGGQQAVAGLHAGNRGGLAGHEDGLLVRLLRNIVKFEALNLKFSERKRTRRNTW